jgi:hypothetical protein
MHQFVNNHLPSSFVNTWTTNAARREETMDQYYMMHKIFVPFSCLTSAEKHPLISFPRTWNELDSLEIKLTSSKSQFNRLLKHFFLEKLKENFVCECLLCSHCHF